MIIIPIGVQCSSATFKKELLQSYTLPFDWMFATPKFVFEILTLLLEKNIDIAELVKNHFFYCDKKANIDGLEHYYICDDGFAQCNTKYNVIFPHDINNDDTISKYIRRFERLKDIILNSQEELCFMYTSRSSLESGSFTINEINVVTDVYYYLSEIYILIGNFRNKYNMIVFDAIQNENVELLHKNIILCKINKCNCWGDLVPQMRIHKNIILHEQNNCNNNENQTSEKK